MNAAVATIVVAVVGVIGTILGATVSAWLSRDKNDADIADKVSEVWERTSGRLDTDIANLNTKCNLCLRNLDLVRQDFGAFIDNMEAWADELAQQVSVPAESQRRARIMFTAARHSHLSHNSRD